MGSQTKRHAIDADLKDTAKCIAIFAGLIDEFFDRLVAAALPRIRDFRGVSSRSFDGRGSYSLGVADQSIFPEIDLDKIKRHQGMDITIVTTAATDDEAYDLLKLMGMPFAGGR